MGNPKFKYYEIGTRGAEDGMEGRSISDAKAFRLTPATPPPLAWDAWYTWKAQETQPRYYRYLKFRLRGWQPYDDCFRFFVADEIVGALQKEPTDPDSQMPMWLFPSQQLEDASKRAKTQKYFLYVLEEDL